MPELNIYENKLFWYSLIFRVGEKNVITMMASFLYIYRFEVHAFPCGYISVYVVSLSSATFNIVLEKITLFFTILTNLTIYFLLHFIHHFYNSIF